MNLGSIVLWGFVATTVLTAFLITSQSIGYTRMSIPLMLGTIFSAGRERANIYGAMLHFLNGWIFAFIYAFIFESIG